MTPIGSSRYVIRGAPSPAEPPPITTGTFNLLADSSFDGAHLKDGTPFTGRMAEIYAGLKNFYIDGQGVLGRDTETNVENRLGSGNSYNIGRGGFRGLMPITTFYRLTGDLELLDELARLGTIAYNSMRTDWHPDASTTRTPHGKRTWVWTYGPSTQNTDMWGTDAHLTDTHRAFAALAPVALALHLNRGHTSPGGYNYGALADQWIAAYEGYEQVWTADAAWDGSWPSGSLVPETYKGFWSAGSYSRPQKDQWPTNKRTLTHSNWGAMVLNYYMGRLLGKSESVWLDAVDSILEPFVNQEVYTTTTPSGQAAFYSRSFSSLTSSSMYLQPVTYSEYVVMDMVQLYLDGNPRSRIVPAESLRRLMRAYAWWVSNSDGSGKADIGGSVPRSGTNKSGHSINLPDACSAAGFCADRTRYQMCFYGLNVGLAWDDTGILEPRAVSAWNDYFSNGRDDWLEPSFLTVPVGVFMKEAGIS